MTSEAPPGDAPTRRNRTRRLDLIRLTLRHIAIVLLVAVAAGQVLVAHFSPLTPWKGGGFGMFSTFDSPQTRSLRVSVLTDSGWAPVAFASAVDSRRLYAAISMPTKIRLQQICASVADAHWTDQPPVPRAGTERTLRENDDALSLSVGALRRLRPRGPFATQVETRLYRVRTEVWTTTYDRQSRHLRRVLITSETWTK